MASATLAVSTAGSVLEPPRARWANTTLTRLALHHTGLDVTACESLATILAWPGVSVRELIVSQNPGIGDAGAGKLAAGLVGNVSLWKLEANHCAIGDGGVRSLAAGLAGNTAVEILRLHHNVIANDGAAALGELLASDSAITELDLEANAIGPRGCEALAAGLAVNRSLAEMVLTGNPLEESGAACLSEALAGNAECKLRLLRIDRCGLRGPAVMSLCPGSLRVLFLIDGGIEAEGAALLGGILASKNHALEQVVLMDK